MVAVRGVFGWLRHSGVPLLLARLAVGGIYIWYGINKLLAPSAFMKALHAYHMLPTSPPQYLTLTVVVMPWIEILCGTLLLLGAWTRSAASLLLLMTIVFTVAVAMRASELAALQGLPLCGVRFDCGCGVGEVWFCSKLAENIALILLAAIATASASRRWTLDALRRPRLAH